MLQRLPRLCIPHCREMTQTHSIAGDKQAMRMRALERRAAIPQARRNSAAAKLADRAQEISALAPGSIVSGFMAIREEIDPSALLTRLNGLGHGLALPVVQGKGRPLTFRQWTPGDALEEGAFGIPVPGADAGIAVPDIMLVPLVAFDKAGYRLGFGAGFYDRTISGLRDSGDLVTVGVAYDEQAVPAVPREPHDQRLDWMLTPTGLRRIADEDRLF